MSGSLPAASVRKSKEVSIFMPHRNEIESLSATRTNYGDTNYGDRALIHPSNCGNSAFLDHVQAVSGRDPRPSKRGRRPRSKHE